MKTGCLKPSWLVLATVIALSLFWGGPIHAQTQYGVTSVDAVTYEGSGDPATIGWEFEIAPGYSIDVNGLGVLDRDAQTEPLSEQHPVAIWSTSDPSSPRATATVDGNSALANGWRWESISPVTLGPGTYRIGAYYLGLSDDFFVVRSGNVTTAPGITYVTGYAQFGGMVYPDGPSELGSYFGPNFSFVLGGDLPIVPEPSALALLVLGAVALLGMTLRNRS